MGKHSRGEGATGTEQQNKGRLGDLFRTKAGYDGTHRSGDDAATADQNRARNEQRAKDAQDQRGYAPKLK